MTDPVHLSELPVTGPWSWLRGLVVCPTCRTSHGEPCPERQGAHPTSEETR